MPAKIIQVPDIPRTKNGKVVELAVKSVVHGMPVGNTDALANPEALELFRNLPALVGLARRYSPALMPAALITLRPLRNLALDGGREFRGRAADDVGADVVELLRHVGHRQDLRSSRGSAGR